MITKRALVFACLLALPVTGAHAQPASDWQDGVFGGQATDLFQGASTQVIAFVRAHDDLASDARLYIQPCAGPSIPFALVDDFPGSP